MNLDLEEGILQGFESWEKEADLVKEAQILMKRLLRTLKESMASLSRLLKSKLKGLLRSTSSMLRDAFRVESLEEQQMAAALYGQELAQSLYQLQLSFAGLKTAVIGAAAPLVQLLLPAVRAAVEVVTGLANAVGYVLRMLFFGSAEAQNFSASLSGAASSGNSLKRTLAGFDQINRLSSSSGSSPSWVFDAGTVQPLTGIWKTLADRLTALLAPLKSLNLNPAAQSLERLKAAVEPLTRALFSGLEWAWNNLLLPLAKWTVEELLPVFLDALSAALRALGVVIEELKPYFTWLWENCLKPLAQWAGNQVITYLQGITTELGGFSDWISTNHGPVSTFIDIGKQFISMVAQAALKTMGWKDASGQAGGVLSSLLQVLSGAGSSLSGSNSAFGLLAGTVSKLAGCFGLVSNASTSAWNGLKSVWQGAWAWLKEKTVDPAFSGVKGAINAIIGLINGMLRSLTAGLNYMTGSMNKLRFTVPDWIPVIGGKTISFGLQSFTAPQIPYLAQGAVLPANKPFMAVVGDQRHGTNIEAPLTTIQEAVSVVMQDHISAMMAGFQALLEENRRLRGTVEAIELGDSVIGAAAQRYAHQMAVITGGY